MVGPTHRLIYDDHVHIISGSDDVIGKAEDSHLTIRTKDGWQKKLESQRASDFGALFDAAWAIQFV